jgi:hypothetical protein
MVKDLDQRAVAIDDRPREIKVQFKPFRYYLWRRRWLVLRSAMRSEAAAWRGIQSRRVINPSKNAASC